MINGGIWGFGIFDNGDATRIENAKKFIKYMADSAHTVEAVKTARYFPVRTAAEGTDLSGVWADNQTMGQRDLVPALAYAAVAAGAAEANAAAAG